MRPCSARPSMSGSAVFAGFAVGAAVPCAGQSTNAARPRDPTAVSEMRRRRHCWSGTSSSLLRSLVSSLTYDVPRRRVAARSCEPLTGPERITNERRRPSSRLPSSGRSASSLSREAHLDEPVAGDAAEPRIAAAEALMKNCTLKPFRGCGNRRFGTSVSVTQPSACVWQRLALHDARRRPHEDQSRRGPDGHLGP